MRTPTAFAAAAALALALALAGCGSGGRHGCASTGGTRAVERGATGTTHYLTGVSLSSSTCADRVAFTFEHRVPGYRVAYVPAGFPSRGDDVALIEALVENGVDAVEIGRAHV